MNRREFLKFSSCGLTFVAVGSTMPLLMRANPVFAHTGSSQLELDMVDVLAEMVDGGPQLTPGVFGVPMWAFKINDSSPIGSSGLLGQPRIPGPAFIALEGDTIRMRIRNRIENGGKHAFAIPGVVETRALDYDEREEIEFTAPRAGTYIYYDPLNAPVNRVMGLHGVLVVLPNPVGNITPYSDPTANIRALFNDLGDETKGFPGHPWDSARNAVWVFSTVDPVKNALAAASTSGSGLSPSTFLDGYLPQYFTINGKSGFFGAQHHHTHGEEGGEHGHSHPTNRFDFDLQANIAISGRVGQPMLIRNVNAGLMWHSPHIHGNHVYELSRANLSSSRTLHNNLPMVDTWTLAPGDVKDVLLPYIAPPDIQPGFWEKVAAETNQEKLPLFYPMHDHNEISNTAAGGNYPHGLVTHWQIDGNVDPHDAVIQVDRAEYRVRSGRLILEGRSSTPGIILDVHPGHNAPPIGKAQVDDQGRWSFRGRSLRALAERTVTIMYHDPAPPFEVHASRTVPLKLR